MPSDVIEEGAGVQSIDCEIAMEFCDGMGSLARLAYYKNISNPGNPENEKLGRCVDEYFEHCHKVAVEKSIPPSIFVEVSNAAREKLTELFDEVAVNPESELKGVFELLDKGKSIEHLIQKAKEDALVASQAVNASPRHMDMLEKFAMWIDNRLAEIKSSVEKHLNRENKHFAGVSSPAGRM